MAQVKANSNVLGLRAGQVYDLDTDDPLIAAHVGTGRLAVVEAAAKPAKPRKGSKGASGKADDAKPADGDADAPADADDGE